jgi:hypothetical protein
MQGESTFTKQDGKSRPLKRLRFGFDFTSDRASVVATKKNVLTPHFCSITKQPRDGYTQPSFTSMKASRFVVSWNMATVLSLGRCVYEIPYFPLLCQLPLMFMMISFCYLSRQLCQRHTTPISTSRYLCRQPYAARYKRHIFYLYRRITQSKHAYPFEVNSTNICLRTSCLSSASFPTPGRCSNDPNTYDRSKNARND